MSSLGSAQEAMQCGMGGGGDREGVSIHTF